MENRKGDVPYCGVRKEKIKEAQPKLNMVNLERQWNWIRERYQIHIKKDVQGLPKPWTTDPVLLTSKFTNVRREHDRQSIYFINKFANNPKMKMGEKAFFALIFRMFNHQRFFDFFEETFGPLSQEALLNLDNDTLREKVEAQGEDVRWFTNAFNTGGLKQVLAFPDVNPAASSLFSDMKYIKFKPKVTYHDGSTGNVDYRTARRMFKDGEVASVEGYEPNMVVRVVRSLRRLLKEDPHYFADLINFDSQQEVYDKLRELPGLSIFLAYQVFVDLTYCPEFKFSENEFTVAGPGCKKGIDMIFEDRDGMTHEEALFWLRDNQIEVYGQFGYIPEKFWENELQHDRCLNVMSLENVHCETLKYIRCVEAIERGERHRTKVKYDGGSGTTTNKLW